MASLLSRMFCRRDTLPAPVIKLEPLRVRRGDVVLLTTSIRLRPEQREGLHAALDQAFQPAGVKFMVLDGADWRVALTSGKQLSDTSRTPQGDPQ